MLLPKLSTILIVLLLAPGCRPTPAPAPTRIPVPVIVKPPSCVQLVGPAPTPPATDAAPAPKVDVDAAERLVTRLRADGDQPSDVAAIAAVLGAALARLRDDEDPAWIAHHVAIEAWRAQVMRTCR